MDVGTVFIGIMFALVFEMKYCALKIAFLMITNKWLMVQNCK